uniref:Uncharacterized protein n=1 Tax=Streptomyces sp. NBC_00180 TaxID=2903632 RepID=A0AAU1HUX6_9ACTN
MAGHGYPHARVASAELVALTLVAAGIAGGRAGLRNRGADGSRTGASSPA